MEEKINNLCCTATLTYAVNNSFFFEVVKIKRLLEYLLQENILKKNTIGDYWLPLYTVDKNVDVSTAVQSAWIFNGVIMN